MWWETESPSVVRVVSVSLVAPSEVGWVSLAVLAPSEVEEGWMRNPVDGVGAGVVEGWMRNPRSVWQGGVAMVVV